MKRASYGSLQRRRILEAIESADRQLLACVQTHPSPQKKLGMTANHRRLSPRFFFRGGGRLYTDYSAEVQEGTNKRIQSSFKLPVEHFIKFISKRTVYLSFPKTAPVNPNGEVLST